ncbi:hypothetical protein NKDENANG_00497 [Candidatus Entotheonellaceae bacterium PAL068K]
MKVCWFHLMAYSHLPQDFEEKYRRVWVDVPSELYEPEKGHWAITTISMNENTPTAWDLTRFASTGTT